MGSCPSDGLPDHAISAAGFAERLVEQYTRLGVKPSDLFAVFVGLVSAHNKSVGAECLIALEAALSDLASGATRKSGEPSV
jgi:hypothetical protein